MDSPGILELQQQMKEYERARRTQPAETLKTRLFDDCTMSDTLMTHSWESLEAEKTPKKSWRK